MPLSVGDGVAFFTSASNRESYGRYSAACKTFVTSFVRGDIVLLGSFLLALTLGHAYQDFLNITALRSFFVRKRLVNDWLFREITTRAVLFK